MPNAFLKKHGLFLLYLVTLVFFTLMFAFPLLYLLIRYFSLSSFFSLFSMPYFYKLFFNTIKQASLSVLFSFLLALPPLLLVCSTDFRFKRFFLSVSYIPFVMPSIIIVLAFVLLFGKNGVIPINILYSLKAVVLAHSFYNFPLVMHTVYSAYITRNTKLERAASTLGAKPLYVFFHVTLPGLLKPLFSSLLLVFMYAFSSFAIVLTLGGGVRNTTFEVEIYKNFKITLDKTLGTSYSVLSFLFMLALILIYRFAFKNEHIVKASSECSLKKGGIGFSLLAILFSFITLFPFIEIFLSVIKNPFTERTRAATSAFRRVFSNHMMFVNSLLIGVISSIIVVFISFVIAEYNTRYSKNKSDVFSFLPLAFSSIALSEGFREVALSSYAMTILFVSLLNALFSFPLVYRIVEKSVSSIPYSVLKAPLTLGSSEVRAAFSVDAPSIKNTLLRAAALSFSLSLGEVSASLVFSSHSFSTLSSAIYGFISRYDYRSGSITGVILLLLSLISAFIIIRDEKR